LAYKPQLPHNYQADFLYINEFMQNNSLTKCSGAQFIAYMQVKTAFKNFLIDMYKRSQNHSPQINFAWLQPSAKNSQ